MPSRLIASVRGIGVAVRVSTSTSARSFFKLFLLAHAKAVFSSMMTSPRFLNLMSGWISLWVPMTRSTLPSARPSRVRAHFPSVLRKARQLLDLIGHGASGP